MFISKHRLSRLLERVELLEQEVRQLKQRTGVYVNDGGYLIGWDGRCMSIVDAVNALAEASNVKFSTVSAQPASLTAVKR